MSDNAATLPLGFEMLEPFAVRWAATCANDRARLRDSSTAEERDAFYAAAKDLLATALDHLDARPLVQLDGEERRLMNLMLSFAHVAAAVEVMGLDEPRHAEFSRHMKIIRAPADAP